jgi:hypothetical protein
MNGTMQVARPSLRERFEAFVQTLDGFESIDALLRGGDPQGKKRADYLVRNRQFVTEQKILQSDPAGRPQKFVDKLATRQVFSGQTDAVDLQRRMVLDIARIIDDNVAAADKQTADTRLIFNSPDAAGILILLNESAGHLQPDVIHYALVNSFQKKSAPDIFRYTANDAVILISEANPLKGFPGQLAFPVLLFLSPQKKHAASITEFSERLIREWATFNNAPLITVPVDINLKPK